jgi:hypothetical protein
VSSRSKSANAAIGESWIDRTCDAGDAFTFELELEFEFAFAHEWVVELVFAVAVMVVVVVVLILVFGNVFAELLIECSV